MRGMKARANNLDKTGIRADRIQHKRKRDFIISLLLLDPECDFDITISNKDYRWLDRREKINKFHPAHLKI